MEIAKTKQGRKAEMKCWQGLIDKEVADMMTLPFIKDVKVDNPPKGYKKVQRSFWSVDPTGDFDTDSQTGREYGVKFCEHITKFPRGSSIFGSIVSDMIARGEFGRIEISFLYVISTALSYSAILTPGVLAREDARLKLFMQKPTRRKKQKASSEPLKLVK